MKHWIIKLEEGSDKETAKIIIQLVAGSLVFASIFAGHWFLLT